MSVEFGQSDERNEHLSLRGRVTGAYNFTPALGAQGDLLLRMDSHEGAAFAFDFSAIDGALHLFYREPENFLLGGIVQLGNSKSLIDGDELWSLNRSYVGAEAQAFFDQITLYGQLGFETLSPDYDALWDADGWFITGEVRHFLTPDFKLEAHAGLSELDLNVDDNAIALTTRNIGVGAEYKFENLPISMFGSYDYGQTSIDGDVAFDSHRVMAGLKLNLGEDSLQDRDRTGASLKPVDFNSLDRITLF